MSFSLWPSAFVDDISKIPAEFLNAYVRVPITRALDGINGGADPLAADLDLRGLGFGFLVDKLRMSGTARVTLESRSITRLCDLSTPFLEVPADWTPLGGMLLQNVTVAAAIDIPIHVPHGATLTRVAVQVDGPAHGGSWPPVSPTSIELYRTNSSGTASAAGPWVDSVAVQATYEGRHYLISDLLSIVVDRTVEAYALRVVCEDGTNSLVGVQVHAVPRVTYTTTQMDED
jgi:hypothetical protein